MQELTERLPASSYNNSVSFMAKILWTHPGVGYTHRMRFWNSELNEMAVNKKEPLNALYPDWDDIPNEMTFASKVEYLMTRMCCLKVPTIELQEDEDGDATPVIVWKVAQHVFPAMCRWARALSTIYNGNNEHALRGYWNGDKDGVDYFGEMYQELSEYQRRMVRTIAVGNFHIVRDLVEDMNDALHAAVHSPDDLQAQVWEDAFGEQTGCYNAFFGRFGQSRMWEAVKRLQSPGLGIQLPKQAYRDDMRLMWRALGWTVNGSHGPRGLDDLLKMVTEFYYRDNPLDKQRVTIGGQASYLPARYTLDVSVTSFSLGILGDRAAHLRNALYPKEIPGFGNLFVPSEDAYAKANGNWERALAVHVAKVVPAHLWTKNGRKNAVKLVQTWGRVRHFSGKEMEGVATRRFVDEMFPLPKSGRHIALRWKEKTGLKSAVSVTEKANRELIEQLRAEFAQMEIDSPLQTLQIRQAYENRKAKGNLGLPYDISRHRGEMARLERELMVAFIADVREKALLQQSKATQRAIHYRFLVMSRVPIAGRHLLRATESLNLLDQFGRKRLSDILRDETGRLGPMKELLMQRASRLLS